MTASPSTIAEIGLLLSGGIDSAVLLGRLLAEGRKVQPFYVRCQLVWEEVEWRAASRFCDALCGPNLSPLVTLEMPIRDLYGDHWSTTGQGTPNAETPDDAVYLPGRNALLAIKPLLWCTMHDIEELAIAVLASDPFADATDVFFDDYAAVIGRATGQTVRLVRPFAKLEKRNIVELGRDLPLEHTFSCIAPVDGVHCGRCNKCAERQRAFALLQLKDPTVYV